MSGDQGDFRRGWNIIISTLVPAAWSPPTTAARAVFLAAERLGVHLQLLDMGGGFPGTAEAEVSFREISCRIKDSLAENFDSQL